MAEFIQSINSSYAAAFLYPFVLLALSLIILNPAKRYVMRNMKQSRLKVLLLRRIN